MDVPRIPPLTLRSGTPCTGPRLATPTLVVAHSGQRPDHSPRASPWRFVTPKGDREESGALTYFGSPTSAVAGGRLPADIDVAARKPYE